MSGFLAFVVAFALFAGQPAGQEHALEHLEPVIFWIPDELPPTYGVCVYAWGYHPMIYAEGRTYSFRRVCWEYGAL